jgi:hypothetical protein
MLDKTNKKQLKGKVNPVTYNDGTEGESMYSSALSLASALGGGWGMSG